MTPYSYYIIKNSNFLTEFYAIPELIDYKNAYPKLAEFEKLCKVRLSKFRGIPKLILFKECEFRYNYRNKNLDLILLKEFSFNPLKLS